MQFLRVFSSEFKLQLSTRQSLCNFNCHGKLPYELLKLPYKLILKLVFKTAMETGICSCHSNYHCNWHSQRLHRCLNTRGEFVSRQVQDCKCANQDFRCTMGLFRPNNIDTTNVECIPDEESTLPVCTVRESKPVYLANVRCTVGRYRRRIIECFVLPPILY